VLALLGQTTRFPFGHLRVVVRRKMCDLVRVGPLALRALPPERTTSVPAHSNTPHCQTMVIVRMAVGRSGVSQGMRLEHATNASSKPTAEPYAH